MDLTASDDHRHYSLFVDYPINYHLNNRAGVKDSLEGMSCSTEVEPTWGKNFHKIFFKSSLIFYIFEKILPYPFFKV